MRANSDNFLYFLRTIITGGGKLSVTPFGTTTNQLSNLQPADGGINEDVVLSLGDAALGSSTTLITDTQGLRALQTNTNLTVATWGFVVPRDYDQAQDKFRVRIFAAMTGNTDTPVLTLTASTLLPAGTLNSSNTLNTTNTLVSTGAATGSTVTQLSPLTISSTLSSTQAVYEFELSGMGLFRDQVVSLKLTTSAHTTDKVNIYGFNVVYGWTITAFTDETLGNDPADLAGTDAFNNPLR